MSYSNAQINFDGIHVACLVGNNGAGKSTLLDAITWTLWEEGRARTDELIKLGQNDMSSEVEFFMEGELYRVYRSRQRAYKNSPGKSNLEFQIFNPKEKTWLSLSKNTTRLTQEFIIQTIKMDYPTFVNSVYLRQGKADEFTLKRPTERKQILADILGLEIYDKLCEKVRENLREIDQKVSLEEALILDLKNKVLKEEKIIKNIDQITSELKDDQEKQKSLQSILSGKEKELNEKKEREKQIQTIEKSRISQGSLIQALEEQLGNLKLKQEKHKEFINNKVQIENEYKKYMEIKENLDLREREKDIYSQLLQERNLLELELKGGINQSATQPIAAIHK